MSPWTRSATCKPCPMVFVPDTTIHCSRPRCCSGRDSCMLTSRCMLPWLRSAPYPAHDSSPDPAPASLPSNPPPPPLLPLPLRSSAAGPCRARYHGTVGGPQQTGRCKKQGWGACGRPRRRDLGRSRRRDLATSLALRVGPRRGRTRTRARPSRPRAIAGRKPRDETRPRCGEKPKNGSRALSEQRASMKVYMFIYTSIYYCCKSFPVLLHDVMVGGWIASYVFIFIFWFRCFCV